MEALDEPYMQISFWRMIRKRAGWLCALFIGEMFTATALGYFQGTIDRATVLALFLPLIISSGGNSGSQGTSLMIRSLALQEVGIRDWWRVAVRELPAGLTLGVILGVIGLVRIELWQPKVQGGFTPVIDAAVGWFEKRQNRQLDPNGNYPGRPYGRIRGQ